MTSFNDLRPKRGEKKRGSIDIEMVCAAIDTDASKKLTDEPVTREQWRAVEEVQPIGTSVFVIDLLISFTRDADRRLTYCVFK